MVRPRRRTWIIAVVVAIAATAGLVVAVRSTAGDGVRRRPVAVWGASQLFPENFFPIISAGNSLGTAQIEIQVLPAPFRVRPDLTVVHDPELLRSEPTSTVASGRQVVTYHLNPQARWSDGNPIEATDFEFSWRIQRSADPARGGCPALLSTTGYDQIGSVAGTGDGGRTVVVTFSRPYADWKSLFRQQLFPAHLMDSGNAAANCRTIERGWPAAGGIPVSGGPWKLDKSDVDPGKQTVSLTPNPAYWGQKPKLERLIWQSFPRDADAVLGALRAGEIDVADPPVQLDLLGPLRALEPRVVTEVRSGLAFDHLDFNVTNVHLRQKPVREAIATALDRPALVRSTVGQIDPAAQVLNNRIYMTSQPEYEATNGGRYERGDALAARRLLEGAGYRAGPDGVYVKDGVRLSLELMTTPADRVRLNAVQVIAAQLRQAGFEIRTFANRDIFADKDSATSLESGRFDMALYSWVSGPFVTANQSIYASPQGESIGQNYTRGGDRRVDQLFGQLADPTSLATTAATANRIDTLLWDDLFTIPLFQRPIIAVHDRQIANVVLNASSDGLAWNANEWTVATAGGG